MGRHFCKPGNISHKRRLLGTGLVLAVGFAACGSTVFGHDVNKAKDLKYGAVLFEYYQQKYFDTLVEFEYAAERGGIHNHGDYPELLKGGVSLSYGLDLQAKEIFSRLIAANTPEVVQNRAWYFLAKMLYLRGDPARAATTLSNIHGTMPEDVDDEYRYLAALINVKLGYYEEAESISRGFDKDSPYAPYLYFNLGVALGKEKRYESAVASLQRSASFADGSKLLDRLADRAHMAMAYLYAEGQQNPANAYAQIKLVSASGIFSNRALLGSAWASVNNDAYQDALGPLIVLQQRSMAIPEVQEAVLLTPHVYEKLGLLGRASNGFISAYDRYGDALAQLDKARESLKGADVLEMFVHNLDEMLGESDWFGTTPSVSLNPLSPFLLDRISDHSFQSVMKDLRDLYAIRNNLNGWKRKQDDFDVILKARSTSMETKDRHGNIKALIEQQSALQSRYDALKQRARTLNAEDYERIQWLLGNLQFDINSAGRLASQLNDGKGVSLDVDSYARLVRSDMDILDKDLEKTNELIGKVENVLRELIVTELDIHEERLKYYRVQAHLAKARILDRSLTALDDPGASDKRLALTSRTTTANSSKHQSDAQGGGNVP
jgi:hypothetical protein